MLLRRLVTLLLIASLLVLALPGPYTAAAPPRPTAAASPAFARLMARAREEGTVRVLVALTTLVHPEGALAETEAVGQRSTIASAQAGLLGRLAAHDVTVIYQYRSIAGLALEVDAATLEALAAAPEVQSISEDTPMVPALAESTGRIGADSAWAAGYTGRGYTVVVIDTGIDPTHPFLKDKVVAEACFASSVRGLCPNGTGEQIGPGSARPCDIPTAECAHGNNVAGIAVGRGEGFSGVAPDATVISIVVDNRTDDPAFCAGFGRPAPCVTYSPSDLLRGLDHIYSLRTQFQIASVNMSMGGRLSFRTTESCDTSALYSGPLFKQVVANLRSAGIVVVASSGNGSDTNGIWTPACISGVISVGAVDRADEVASYSNTAPILDILSPAERTYTAALNGGFGWIDGTSMAAPHVAGAVAVLRQAKPTATAAEIEDALLASGVPLRDYRTGQVTPRLQLDAAVARLLGQPALTIQQRASATLARAGQPVTYTVEVRNVGAQAVANLAVTLPLPPGLSLAGPITLHGANGTVASSAADLPTLARGVNLGASGTFSLTVPLAVGATVADGTQLRSTTTVSGPGMARPARHTLELPVQAQGQAAPIRLNLSTTTHRALGQTVVAVGDIFAVAAIGSGEVYLFARADGHLVKTLKPSSGAATSAFGSSLAASGDVLAVGAPATSSNKGVVYLYRRNQGGADNWGLVKQINAADGAAYHYFGDAVALSGDELFVGAPDYAGVRGAVYVFGRNQGGADGWGQTQRLQPDTAIGGDYVGMLLAVQGQTLVVGAPVRWSVVRPGSVYIYRRSTDGTWTLSQQLSADVAEGGNGFGRRLALQGDTLAVGALTQGGAGAVYVYTRSLGGGEAWGLAQKLTTGSGRSDKLGRGLALDGDRLVAGASEYAGRQGVVVVFERQGATGRWSHTRTLSADGVRYGDFGMGVALAGDVVIAGAPGADSGKGRAYRFNLGTAPAPDGNRLFLPLLRR